MPNAVRRFRPRSFGLAFGAALVLIALVAPGTEAHKAVTSPYNYNDHVFPIVRDRCGRCHFPDGPAPMSLLTYTDTLPWAESMREQLVGERMLPWYADPMGPVVKGGHSLTPRELDVLVTWATGGTPLGDLNTKLPPVPAHPQWRSGPPDLAIKMDEAHTVPAGTMEENCEFELPTGLTETKWVKAVDLVPGVTSMVRDAIVTVENGPVLMAWVPGHDAIAAPSGAAFKLPAGAKLRLQIHYKKNWQDEQKAKTDRTTIGLYFTDEPISGRSIDALTVDAAGAPAAPAGGAGSRRISRRIGRAAQALETLDGSRARAGPATKPRSTVRLGGRAGGAADGQARPLAAPARAAAGMAAPVLAGGTHRAAAGHNGRGDRSAGAAQPGRRSLATARHVSGRARLRRTVSPTTKLLLSLSSQGS